MKVTESNAIARLEFASVSSNGGAELFAVMLKTCDMLKKTLSMASTLTRAVVPGTFGTVNVAVPVFGVLDRRVKGKLLPPSMESRTRTFAQLTGALEVLATSQVTV